MCADRASGRAVRDVVVRLGDVSLPGTVTQPSRSRGIVVFAHGSGSSRLSPRNLEVAGALVRAGFTTFLLDLLTAEEGRDRAMVFDIALLGDRLAAATRRLREDPELARQALGYFGASTGAAAALRAAVTLGEDVRAIVSRGGRPDLAGDALPLVRAPVLLIVGGDDRQVLELNEQAQKQLRCETDLAVVPGATHLFEEPGALETVADQAGSWFDSHLQLPAAA